MVHINPDNLHRSLLYYSLTVMVSLSRPDIGRRYTIFWVDMNVDNCVFCVMELNDAVIVHVKKKRQGVSLLRDCGLNFRATVI